MRMQIQLLNIVNGSYQRTLDKNVLIRVFNKLFEYKMFYTAIITSEVEKSRKYCGFGRN